MCGILGIFTNSGKQALPPLAQKALDSIRHRGPDDEGYLLVNTKVDQSLSCRGRDTDQQLHLPGVEDHSGQPFNLVLGHRRLSIIDLSPAGHQPLPNEDQTVWIVYNGEIYNHEELREELKRRGHAFRSRADTEVIVHAYEEWGTDCLRKFNGMWAFAIWDSKRKHLFCSRDRFGIKPFYYYFDGEIFLFASEIKALLETSLIQRKPNDGIIYDYLADGLVDHCEESFFAGVKKLAAGHYLLLRLSDNKLETCPYYNLRLDNKIPESTDGILAGSFYTLFKDSVQTRLAGDVPIGSCLSGGLDSSSIVCLIDQLTKESGIKLPGGKSRQRTFSARYHDGRHDEGKYIEAVVKKTGAEGHITYPGGEKLHLDLQKLIWHQEEPFASTSVYAQWEVFKLIRQSGVKVVLDGQGGDELLAGYHRYFHSLLADLARTFQWKKWCKELNAYIHLPGKPPIGLTLFASAARLLPGSLSTCLRRLITSRDPWINQEFAGQFKSKSCKRTVPRTGKEISILDHDLAQSLRFAELPSYLRYEDKNSMAHSVEARLPFLDYRLVEFAFSLPWNQKIAQGTTKRVLRNALKNIVPEAILNRRDKIGFSTPEDTWFRSSMKELIAEIIESESFRQRPFYNLPKIKSRFEAHQQGLKNLSASIWRWINLEIWLRLFID